MRERIPYLPGRCGECGQFIYYSRRSWRDRPKSTKPHACPANRDRCGYRMPISREPCARPFGHGSHHQSQYALDNQYRSRHGRERVA